MHQRSLAMATSLRNTIDAGRLDNQYFIGKIGDFEQMRKNASRDGL
jgi:hypothetical protein